MIVERKSRVRTRGSLLERAKDIEKASYYSTYPVPEKYKEYWEGYARGIEFALNFSIKIELPWTKESLRKSY